MTRQIVLADRVLASDIELTGWAGEVAELTKPDHIAWCDGSYPEWERLTDLLVEQGTFTRLNSPGSPRPLPRASPAVIAPSGDPRTLFVTTSLTAAAPRHAVPRRQ